jgi:predicted PurR-regulated permease PerM
MDASSDFVGPITPAAPVSPAGPDLPSAILREDAEAVPRGLRIAAAWSWRVVALILAAFVLLWLVGRLHVVLIPLAIALLLSALLSPGASWLRRHGVPRSLAAAIMLISGLVVVAGTLTIVINAFVNGFSDLSSNVVAAVQQIRGWLANGPVHLSDAQISAAITSAQNALEQNRDKLTNGAVATATTLGEILTGFFLVLFSTFFYLQDGRGIWNFLTGLLPRGARAPVYHAGEQGWRTLTAYVRATALVAFIDAVGIGVGAWILGVPLPLAIGALVFLASFVPIIGATVSGVVAVLVALVSQGPIKALILLIIVIGVQQLEGHILQPLLLGRAVAVHPLAVIGSIAVGGLVGGLPGALVAVPIVAVLNTMVRSLLRQSHLEPVGGLLPGNPGSPDDSLTGPPRGIEDTRLGTASGGAWAAGEAPNGAAPTGASGRSASTGGAVVEPPQRPTYDLGGGGVPERWQ